MLSCRATKFAPSVFLFFFIDNFPFSLYTLYFWGVLNLSTPRGSALREIASIVQTLGALFNLPLRQFAPFIRLSSRCLAFFFFWLLNCLTRQILAGKDFWEENLITAEYESPKSFRPWRNSIQSAESHFLRPTPTVPISLGTFLGRLLRLLRLELFDIMTQFDAVWIIDQLPLLLCCLTCVFTQRQRPGLQALFSPVFLFFFFFFGL